MKFATRAEFSERLRTAAEARKALLEGFRPKPAIAAPDFQSRSARKAARLQQVRADRAEAKQQRHAAAERAKSDAEEAQALHVAAALVVRREERKERKALTKAESKTKRDARYAARKARR